jgi:ATPase subunit of ABC transporter with duplicated ATPase domains
LAGFPKHLKISLVKQNLDVKVSNQSALETVVTIVQETRLGPLAVEEARIEAEIDDLMATAPDDERIAVLSERLGEIEELRTTFSREQLLVAAEDIMLGLGFKAERRLCPSNKLSGGWRMRLALTVCFCPQILFQ